jgi:hypothetical protein
MDETGYTPNQPSDPVTPITDAYLHRDVHPDEKAEHMRWSPRDSIAYPKQGHECAVEDPCEYWKYC